MKITLKQNDKLTVVKVNVDEYGYTSYKCAKKFDDVCELALFAHAHNVNSGFDYDTEWSIN